MAMSEDKQSDNIINQNLKKMKGKVFLSLGYGVNAYFETLVSFIKLYLLMSVVNIGLILIYYSYDGFRTLSGASLTSKVSIGNMGFSEPLCMTVNFGVDHSLLACPYGSINKIYSFGIHPMEDTPKVTNDGNIFDFFKPRNKGVRCRNKESDPCNKFIDEGKFRANVEKTCLGKDACAINNFSSYLKTDKYLLTDEYYA